MSEELIVKLIEEQDEKRAIQIKGIQKNMEAGFDTINSKMVEMLEADKKRNGKIECIEKDIRIVRWFSNNPVKGILIAVSFVMAVAFAFHAIDFRASIRSKFGIELKDTLSGN